MSNHFPAFAKLVAADFQALTKYPQVFVVDLDGDALYAAYLAAFPEGANPLFKIRTEHECSCCKQFIRRAGNVVAVDEEGLVHTVWDQAAKKASYPYNVVASAMVTLLEGAKISDLYRVGKSEASFGAVKTNAMTKEGDVQVWNHFHTGEIPTALRSATPDKDRGEYRQTVQVFERGLVELTPDALATVADLIASNNLYRGLENQRAVLEFQKAQQAFLAKSAREKNDFLWTAAESPFARFRNTAIGTLVIALSEGAEIDEAVRSFEGKVDATNYKRTSAVITPMMVKSAMETIASLGLEPALERRFARIDDVSVNDVLWVDSTVKPLMKGGLGDVLLQAATVTTRDTSADEKRAEDIAIDDFIKSVLPQATGLELLFKGEHLGNLMSLTAPVHEDPKPLFKWSNNFAWSYNGNVADSIRERVKKAGGNVTNAKLRVSLSWFNFDDLDLHVYEPNGHHIWYGDKQSPSSGFLDVDMNAGSGKSREPVENVSWVNLRDGAYQVAVNNYSRRETSDVGFIVETESGGKLSHFTYSKGVQNAETIKVVTLHVKGGVIQSIEIPNANVTTTAISQEKWGLRTEQYVKVNAVTLSPNYWGENAVGNKHTFFVLEGAKNEEPTRGIYNEFLSAKLMEHRKVFEVIGDKTKCQPTEGQLSGLGFSSTKPDQVIAKVTQGKKQRLYNIRIGA